MNEYVNKIIEENRNKVRNSPEFFPKLRELCLDCAIKNKIIIDDGKLYEGAEDQRLQRMINFKK